LHERLDNLTRNIEGANYFWTFSPGGGTADKKAHDVTALSRRPVLQSPSSSCFTE